MNNTFAKFKLNEILSAKKEQQTFRELKVSLSNNQYVKVNNQDFLNFSSNDYLGLSQNPHTKKALIKGIELYGGGSGASALITGFSKAHYELCEYLKELTHKECVILFGAGFSANQALIKAFTNLNANLYLDKLVHASMIDALINDFFRYKHLSKEHLIKLINLNLEKDNNKPSALFTEGLYSMDGDMGNLKDLVEIRNQYNIPLVVDDAHGFGVIGEGLGSLKEQGLDYLDTDIYMATFSKAIGLQGAFIACSKDFGDFLVNTSREVIYSTSMPPFLAYAIKENIKYILSDDGLNLRENLKTNIKIFKDTLKERAISDTHIQPIILKENDKTLKAYQKLMSQGFYVGAIRPPTVPQNTSRLRISLRGDFSNHDVTNLAQAIGEILGE